MPAMTRTERSAQSRHGALARHLLTKGRKGPLCRRFLRRVHLPERGRAQDGAGERHGRGCRRQADHHRPCGLQQHRRTAWSWQRHAESLGVDAIAAIPPDLLPPAGSCDCRVLERHQSAAAPHTDFVIYNIPQLAGVALTSLSSQRDAEKSQCHRREKLLHAGAGYPGFQGSWRRGQHCL